MAGWSRDAARPLISPRLAAVRRTARFCEPRLNGGDVHQFHRLEYQLSNVVGAGRRSGHAARRLQVAARAAPQAACRGASICTSRAAYGRHRPGPPRRVRSPSAPSPGATRTCGRLGGAGRDPGQQPQTRRRALVPRQRHPTRGDQLPPRDRLGVLRADLARAAARPASPAASGRRPPAGRGSPAPAAPAGSAPPATSGGDAPVRGGPPRTSASGCRRKAAAMSPDSVGARLGRRGELVEGADRRSSRSPSSPTGRAVSRISPIRHRPEARQAGAQQVDVGLVEQRQQPGQHAQPVAAPGADHLGRGPW